MNTTSLIVCAIVALFVLTGGLKAVVYALRHWLLAILGIALAFVLIVVMIAPNLILVGASSNAILTALR